MLKTSCQLSQIFHHDVNVKVDCDRDCKEGDEQNNDLDRVDLMCPLTMELLEHPVCIIGEDQSHVFSKNALLNWEETFLLL